jgi:putative ABC transport system ATP-binding protein
VLGQELNNAREKTLIRTRRAIGYVFQNHNLLDSLTIQQNVQMSLQLAGVRPREGRERIAAVLERVGLAEYAHKRPSELSGGQKQRAGIARALVNHPSIVLADEPTASLDKKAGRDVVELIQELARADDAAVILVTHDNRVLDVADRILNLEDGHMKSLSSAVSEGTSRMLNLLEKHDPHAATYLAAFTFALARVAHADRKVTEDERARMQQILHDIARLDSSEVDFIMELAMMQRSSLSVVDSRLKHPPLGRERGRMLIRSLFKMAEADGQVSPEEVVEIQAIAAEFGLEDIVRELRS